MQISKDKPIKLSAYTLLRRNCHSSSQNYICYLTSTTQVRVCKLSGSVIQQEYSLQIPLEPVRSIAIYQIGDTVYVAASMITRYHIYKGRELYFQNTLKLDCNIVYFVGGFIKVVAAEINGNPSFVFAKMDGQITIFDIINKNRLLKLPQKRSIDSYHQMALVYPIIYFGDSRGKINANQINADEERYHQIGEHDTKSNMPILNILAIPTTNEIVCTTCMGELIMLSPTLSIYSLISIHHSAIVRLLLDNQKNILYSFGEDSIMHMLKLCGNRKIKVINSQKFQQTFSSVFRCKGSNYLSLYERKQLIKI